MVSLGEHILFSLFGSDLEAGQNMEAGGHGNVQCSGLIKGVVLVSLPGLVVAEVVSQSSVVISKLCHFACILISPQRV